MPFPTGRDGCGGARGDPLRAGEGGRAVILRGAAPGPPRRPRWWGRGRVVPPEGGGLDAGGSPQAPGRGLGVLCRFPAEAGGRTTCAQYRRRCLTDVVRGDICSQRLGAMSAECVRGQIP